MSLEEAILDKVRRLPPAKQEQVLLFADGLQQQAGFKKVPVRDRQREVEWIKANRTRYADQWVVVDGERLIAADLDGHKAFEAAKAAGVEVPFLIHMVLDDSLPLFQAGEMAVSIEFAVSCRYSSFEELKYRPS